jgi:hypothetical protein
MELTYWIIYLIVHIMLGIVLGIICSEIAKSKGHNSQGNFWAGFLFLFAGLLIVIGYKDLKSEEQNYRIISLLNDIKINTNINKSK